MKAGKVVVMLNGRYAGCKAVVVKVLEGSDDRKAKGSKARNQLIVVGLSQAPKAVTKAELKKNLKLDGKSKEVADKSVQKRQRVKTFVKLVNFTHVMPTRYNVELHEELNKHSVSEESVRDPALRKEMRKSFKDVLQLKYKELGAMTDGKLQKHTLFFFKCVGADGRRARKRAGPAPPFCSSAPISHASLPPRPLPFPSLRLQEAPILNPFAFVYFDL